MNTGIGLWTGVDVFLCISGYVITKAFGEDIRAAAQAGSRAWQDEAIRFLVRRGFRLLPASLFWIAAAYALSNLFNRSGAFGSPAQNLQDSVAIVLSVANIYFAACTTGLLNGCGPNAIYWTVSLEQQFYLLFPLMILLRNRTILVLSALVFLFFAFVPRDVWIYYNRVDTLAIGMAIALLSRTSMYNAIAPTGISETACRFLSAGALLGFLLFGTAGLIVLGRYPCVPALVAATCGIIVLLASYDRGYLFPDVRLTKIMAAIGERSFSVYHTHNLAMAASTETFQRFVPAATLNASWDVPMVAVALLFLVLFTEASYRFIEIPFRARGKELVKAWRWQSTAPRHWLARLFY